MSKDSLGDSANTSMTWPARGQTECKDFYGRTIPVPKVIREYYGKEVAYDLAKAIWWEYQHRTEGCDCVRYN